ncbi:MAG TPA: VWA domain-containing protein [Gemmataceae bacterium]|nr:VWA domain-containing protein [Gemmataceae bacterium]
MAPNPSDGRRLPVYLLLDCSTSMTGEPIAAIEMGLCALLDDLRNDPQALETVWLSVITFASGADVVVELTPVEDFQPPELSAYGVTALGEAIRLLGDRIAEEVRVTGPNRKGDWKPLVFVLTDGEPTDDWQSAVDDFRLRGQATVVACGAGSAINEETLRRLGDTVVRLKDARPGTLGAFMRWVSSSVTTASQVLGARAAAGPRLPEPPEGGGIQIVL